MHVKSITYQAVTNNLPKSSGGGKPLITASFIHRRYTIVSGNVGLNLFVREFSFRKDSNFLEIPICLLVHVVAYLFIMELSVYCKVEQVHLWQFFVSLPYMKRIRQNAVENMD